MSNHPVPDHNRDMMREDFGTEFLITDPKSDKILREVVGDHKHDLKRQTLLHESIRNDEDYDDWEYGTEPSYGKDYK